ncbi:MAG: hypothetical protein MJ000_12295, partial [Bacteroidales bacterium]|nr:hypothetical protein [Bacteroidales bacterium]
MKIKVERAVFQDALKQVQSVVPSKTVLPIVANVKIEASEDGSIVLTATQIDLTYVASVHGEVSKPGSTTIPAKLLLSAVQK